ncbi:MAG: phospho-N-acetylmuramoyl-pentapeptide-transferase [Lachnospiraceae bacterium]|nr:phospho-N-acetylmuramoyl-pentapeptide-transferase [Lachnospiraceae bacterium]
MINELLNGSNIQIVAMLGIFFAFITTCVCIGVFKKYLPHDMGREFAHNGALSAGKPRGAGFIFVLVFIGATCLFAKMNYEIAIYLILVAAAMLTGFLDDAAKAPWGELKKGLLDLVIAIMVAITFLNYNSNTITIAMTGDEITIHPVIFGVLVVILVWASINVTNCTDGVDGLSGTLAIITLISIYMIDKVLLINDVFSYTILIFVICILGYLWFNATPSVLLMGDAGSRAMGLYIAIAILKTGSPLLYLLVALIFIVDGGLGLVKVSLLRFFKIKILKNVRTPIHDHVRKVWDWSNTQTVFRFAIIHIMICVATIYLIML